MSSACRRSGRSSADCWGGWRRRGAKKFAQQQPQQATSNPRAPPARHGHMKPPAIIHTTQTAKKFAQQHPHLGQTAKKFAQQQPHLGQTAKKLSQRAQKHRKPAIFAEQGELFRASRSESPRRANFFAQPQHATSNPRAPPARRAQESAHKKAHATKHPRQGTYTSATGRQLLVVHRSLLPLVVIHRLTRKA